MTEDKKRRSTKAGLPPGTLIHIGARHAAQAKAVLRRYDEHRFSEQGLAEGQELPAPETGSVLWIHVDGLHDIALLERLGGHFGLHPLILEDILNTDQRPKVEDHGDYLYIVLKRFSLAEAGIRLVPEQVSIVLGAHWLLSFQEKEGSLLDPICDRLRTGMGRLRKGGTDSLTHALIDGIVDGYFLVLDHFGERIEAVEELLVTRPTPATLRTLQALKRAMILLRKSVWPLREMISRLERAETPLLGETSSLYFRDVYDHTIQVIDTVETYREMLSGMLDIYLSSLSNRMNEIMKVLTIIATIFMPLTFLAGIYGMNFRYMPELEWPWGYFALWGVMIAIAMVMLFLFKKRKWL